MKYKCKKCGKEYKRKYYYKKHITKCKGKKSNMVLRRKEKKKKFLEIFEKSKGLLNISCDIVGVTKRTILNWKNEDIDFNEKVTQIRDKQIDWVESKLLNLIDNGNVPATLFFLKTQAKDRGYIESNTLFNQADVEINITPAKKKDDKNE